MLTGPTLATRIPDFCDVPDFYAALSSAGVAFEKGRRDEVNFQKLTIRASDELDFEEVLVSWGY